MSLLLGISLLTHSTDGVDRYRTHIIRKSNGRQAQQCLMATMENYFESNTANYGLEKIRYTGKPPVYLQTPCLFCVPADENHEISCD